MPDPPRIPPGTPSGGQFSAHRHGEADLQLRFTPAEAQEERDMPARPSPAQVTSASPDELWAYIEHPDPSVRVDAACNLEVTVAQLNVLLDPTRQPAQVRWLTARLPWSGVAEQASRDPNPLVRLVAAEEGWDLSPDTRARLAADPDVIRVREILQPA